MASLRFAVVSSSDDARLALESFCLRLASSTGLKVLPRVFGTYSELRDEVLSAQVQIVWAPPLIAVELEDRRAAKSIAVVQRSTRAGYYGALFARSSSALRDVRGLSAVSVAWVSRESASGYVVPRWHLRSLGISLSTAFAEERFLGSHEAVTQAVLDGDVDVGATHVGLDPVERTLKSAPWMLMGLPASAVRVLLLIGPIPSDVVMVSTAVPAVVRTQLTGALLSVLERREADTVALFEASRFEPVPDGHLEMLRRLSRFGETRA